MNDLQVPYSEGGDFIREIPTMGEHQAVCSQIHNLGHQSYQGKVSISPKVVLLFEIDQKMAQEGKFKGQQMLASKEFAMYFGKDNDLRKFISDWRGVPLTDEQAKNYNLSKLLGQPATLIVIHNTSKDKTYANIAGIAKAKAGVPVVPVTLKDTPEWIIKKKSTAVPAPSKESKPTVSAQQEDDLPF